MASLVSTLSIVVFHRDDPLRLERCLRSIENQLYPASEVIVVDLAPEDARQWLDRGGKTLVSQTVRCVRPETGSGKEAWNVAAVSVRGDLVAFVESSDELLPLATEYFTHGFRRHRWADACYGRAVQRDEFGRLLPSEDGRRPDGNVFNWLLTTDRALPLSVFSCRRSLLSSNLVTGEFPRLEAQEFLLRAALIGKFYCVQEDVAIVQHKLSDHCPELASQKCRLIRHFCESSKAFGRQREEHLAACEFDAAIKWWKAGRRDLAVRHARSAAALVPWNPRYWLLAGVPRWLATRPAA